MSDSTTNLDTIQTGQAQKEVTANALFDAASPAMMWGRRASTTSGLTWGYYGGTILIAGTPTKIANGTLQLSPNDTYYIYLEPTGSIKARTTMPDGWPGPIVDVGSPYDSPTIEGAVALYQVVTGASTITSWTDYRLAVGAVGSIGPQGPQGPQGDSWAVSVNAQTGTSYQLQASDNGKVVTLNNASPITLTVPSGLGANFACEIVQLGAGGVTVTPSSVTINSFNGFVDLAGQYAAATLLAYSANVFLLTGNIT